MALTTKQRKKLNRRLITHETKLEELERKYKRKNMGIVLFGLAMGVLTMFSDQIAIATQTQYNPGLGTFEVIAMVSAFLIMMVGVIK